jgi:aspartate aminotransferase
MMQVIADDIQRQMSGASWIRKMFEKGLELKREFGNDNVFDFSLGNPDMPPPPQARGALAALAERVCEPLEMGYCPNAGLPAFREKLAVFLAAQQQAPVRAGHVVVTCGAAGALTSFFRAVLDPGDEVMCPAPYFVEYGAYCGHFGGVLKPVPARTPEFQPDLDAMAAAVTERTRVILINSPNNPSGCVYTRETLGRLAELLEKVNAARRRPLFLVSDEPYRFLTYDGVEVPPVLNLSPYALALGSFSKSLSLAGERVGYIVANPAMPDVGLLINAVTMTGRTLGFVNSPVLGQRLAMALLGEGVDVAVYDRRRRAMAEVLSAAGIEFAMPRGAFYFFPKAPCGDDQGFVRELLAHNILAVPGTGFGYPGHFRLTFCVDQRVIERSAPGFKAAVRGRS